MERSQRLESFVSKHVNDSSAVSGIIHEAMLKLLDGQVKQANDRKKAWRRLLATVRNVARNRSRYEDIRRTEPLETLEPSPARVCDGRERGWRICERMERYMALDAALESLTEDQREVVVLRYYKDRTIAEVAAHRRCSQSAVKQLTRNALVNLEKVLDGRFCVS